MANGNTSREAVVNQLIEMSEFAIMRSLGIDKDFDLGEAQRAQLKKYFHNPNELHISINPHDPLDTTYLKFFKPKDIPLLLNLKLTSV